jgi:hypothetical protein
MLKTVCLIMVLNAPTFAQAAPPDPAAAVPSERASIQTMYSLIASMPVAQRKILFHGFSAETKATLWQIHLERFAAEHSLTEEQRGVIAEASALFTSGLYSATPADSDFDSRVNTPLRRLEERARQVLGRDLAFEAIARVGPADSVDASSATTVLVDGSRATAFHPSRPVPKLMSNCSCSWTSDWCYAYMSCTGSMCYYGFDGCGTGWRYACDGSCRY